MTRTNVRNPPAEQPQRRIGKPDDLRAGDEVFVFRREWTHGRIVRIHPERWWKDRTLPPLAVVAIETVEVDRPLAELIPRGFICRPGDPLKQWGMPRPTMRRKAAIEHARELWRIALTMGGVVV